MQPTDGTVYGPEEWRGLPLIPPLIPVDQALNMEKAVGKRYQYPTTRRWIADGLRLPADNILAKGTPVDFSIDSVSEGESWVPAGIYSIVFHHWVDCCFGNKIWAQVKPVDDSLKSKYCQMELFDGSGALLVSFEGFRYAKLESTLVEAETSMSTTKWIESSHLDSVAKSSTAPLPVEDQGLDIALVARVNELFDRNMFEPFVCAGMLSPTGRCHTFDASADG